MNCKLLRVTTLIFSLLATLTAGCARGRGPMTIHANNTVPDYSLCRSDPAPTVTAEDRAIRNSGSLLRQQVAGQD